MKMDYEKYFDILTLFFCILLGIFFYRGKNTNKGIRILPYFLIITLIVELIGTYLVSQINNQHIIQNYKKIRIMYNTFTSLEFSFYLWMINEIIKSKKISKLILVASLSYFIVAILNTFFIQGKSGFHSITYAIGSLLIAGSCIFFFFELFLSKQAFNLVRMPSFWICVALSFYYLCTFPIFGLANFLDSYPDIIKRNLQSIVIAMNVLLYLMFSIAFLCRNKIKKSSPSLS